QGWLSRPTSAADQEVLVLLEAERIRNLVGDPWKQDRKPLEAPTELPVITDLAAGPEGTIWVQRTGDLRRAHPMATGTPDPPRGWGGSAWDVLDPEGRYLGTVDLPPRFRLGVIRDSLLVGVQADARYQDAVGVLRLHRPGPRDGS
ncbi:MAG: hypothetical protein P8188_08280, partial [Gemmatimonadota bacterium]